MKGYTAKELEDALGKLWILVEDRLTDEDRKALGINIEGVVISGIFEELVCYGPGGPMGWGLGRIMGAHALGE